LRGRKENKNQGQGQKEIENNQREVRPVMASLQVWPRRQKMQKMLKRPTPIEGIKRTNTVVVKNLLQGQRRRRGEIRRNSCAIQVDRRRNCYSYGGFGHMTKNYKNRRRTS